MNSYFASVSVSTSVLAPDPVDSLRLISRNLHCCHFCPYEACIFNITFVVSDLHPSFSNLSFKSWQKNAITGYLGEQIIKIGKPADFC
ncbi:unnamed protein product [Camellia sinensis]